MGSVKVSTRGNVQKKSSAIGRVAPEWRTTRFHQLHELRHEKNEREDGQAQQRVGENFAADIAIDDAHHTKEPPF